MREHCRLRSPGATARASLSSALAGPTVVSLKDVSSVTRLETDSALKTKLRPRDSFASGQLKPTPVVPKGFSVEADRTRSLYHSSDRRA